MFERTVTAKRLVSRPLPMMAIGAVLLLICCNCHALHLQQSMLDDRKSKNHVLGPISDGFSSINCDSARRNVLRGLFGAATTTALVSSSPQLSSASATAPNDSIRHPFAYSDSWVGTSINIVSLEDATKSGAYASDESGLYWSMGKWPDPALRIPAKPIDPSQWLEGASPKRHQRLELAATILRDTARREGAVGLAAQQCGVDARMVFLSSAGGGGGMMGNNNSDGDMVLVNPRIVARSSESSMKVWTEECLVLPPTFRATVLRDDWIDVEYDASFEYRSQQRDSKSREPVLSGWSQTPIRKRFFKEQSRCLQHELDHDRGILITDHVGLDELENNVMRTIEAEGHDRRQAIAYSRL